MALKSDKPKNSAKKTAEPKKFTTGKPELKKDIDEDDDLDDIEDKVDIETKPVVKSKKSSKKKSDDEDEDDDEQEVEIADEWEKPEEEDNWDPDFDEFDIPKSKTKKAAAKKPSKDEDDFKVDSDFKELGLFDDMDDNAGSNYDDDDY